MTTSKLTIDTSADAAYFKILDGKVSQTKEIDDLLLVDIDQAGNVLGVEFLSLELLSEFDPDSISSYLPLLARNELKHLLQTPLKDQLNSKQLSLQ